MMGKLTTEERAELRFMLGTVRDLRSVRARTELNSLVGQARAEAWRLKMGGARRKANKSQEVKGE